MKQYFIEPMGFHSATLCSILLQVSNMSTDPIPSTIISYIDKLGTIGLLIYFLWRDKRDSRKREERYEKEKDEMEKRYQQEMQAKVLFFEQQLQKQQNFYEAFYSNTLNKNHGTGKTRN